MKKFILHIKQSIFIQGLDLCSLISFNCQVIFSSIDNKFPASNPAFSPSVWLLWYLFRPETN